MKENINSFSFRRVGLLIKRDVVGNWKALLNTCAFSVVALLFLMYLAVPECIARTDTMGASFDYVELFLNVCKGAFKFALMILACGAMGVMGTKEGRIDFLKIPATNMEKFIARYLCVFLCFVGVVLVGFLGADVLHALVFPFLSFGQCSEVTDLIFPRLFDSGSWESVIALDADMIDRFSRKWDWSAYFFVYTLQLMSCSTMALGGNFWRKNALWKTWGVTIVLGIVFTLISVVWITNISEQTRYAVFYEYYDFLILPSSVLFLIVSVLCWYWAYRLFCRSQVVEPKRFKS